MATEEIIIGPAKIILLNPDHQMKGETVKGFQTTGSGPLFQVVIPPDIELKLVDVSWANDERDVRATEAPHPKAVRRLDTGSLRLSVNRLPNQRVWVELSQARINAGDPGQHSNLKKASQAELDEGAGLSVSAVLMRYGAEAVDTRGNLHIPGQQRRNFFCAVFDPANQELPIISFVLTRVLSLVNEYSKGQLPLF